MILNVRDMEARQKAKKELRDRKDSEVAVLVAGFSSEFWSILEREWVFRLKMEENIIKQTPPGTPENNAKIVDAQAKIAVIEGMFYIAREFKREVPGFPTDPLKK